MAIQASDRRPSPRASARLWLSLMLLLLFAFPYYALLTTGEVGSIMLATILALAVIHAMLYSVQASLLPELFSTRLRYTGASLSYQLAGPVVARRYKRHPSTWTVRAGLLERWR